MRSATSGLACLTTYNRFPSELTSNERPGVSMKSVLKASFAGCKASSGSSVAPWHLSPEKVTRDLPHQIEHGCARSLHLGVREVVLRRFELRQDTGDAGLRVADR